MGIELCIQSKITPQKMISENPESLTGQSFISNHAYYKQLRLFYIKNMF